MSARAVRRLFEIPLKISPLAGPFVAGIIAFLEAGVLWFGFATRATGGLPSTSNVFVLKIGLLLVGILGSMFLSLLGQGLRSIARPETRLLPHLGRNLAAAGSLWFTFLWLVPLVLAGIFGLFSPTLLVAVGGLTALLFVWALFVNAWPFPRGMLPVVLAFFGLPLLPPPFRRVLLAAALSAPVGAAALVLAGALLVKLARHLFAPADTPEALAPLSAIGMGSLRANPRRATAQSARPSRLRSRVEAWVTAPVGARLEKRLALLRARPDHRHRVRAVRLLLMPAENPRGWLVRLVTLAFFLGLYALAFLSGGPRPGSFHTLLFGYIVLAGFSSMSVIPFARERTRRHLAELYLTLGLETPQDFRAVVADAYLGILTGVVVVTLSLLVLAAVLLSPTRILTIFLTGLVVLPPLALFLLAAVLHMPERTLPRVLLGIPLFGLTFLALPIALVVMRDLGVTTGALVTGVTGAIVAAGTWRASRRLWIESPLDFGAPDPRLPL